MKKTVAALLCLIMLVCLLPLAAAEEAAFEPNPAFMDLFKLDYEITDPVYGAFYENKYVSDDGTIEKWYSSYLPTIDGLKRTGESRKCDLALDEPCDIQEEHAHLYLETKKHRYFLPFYSEEVYEYNGLYDYAKTPLITQVNKDSLFYMKKYNLHRITDNIAFMQIWTKHLTEGNIDRFLCFKPISVQSNIIVLEPVYLDATTSGYTNEMNGLLIDPRVSTIKDFDEWNKILQEHHVDYFYRDDANVYWSSDGVRIYSYIY